MKTLYGITVALLTPFSSNYEVDYDKLAELTKWLIFKGIHCLFCCGTDSEFLHLTIDERKKIAETVVKNAQGRVPVYIQCGAMLQKDTLELALHAQSIKADGIGLVTPAYFPVTEREMEQYYITVCKTVNEDFPVYIYNIPQCTTNDIKPDTVKRLTQLCPNIAGIKYNYPSIDQTLAYTMLNNWSFSVLQGEDRTLTSWLAMGCAGTVSGSANVFPEPLVAGYNAYMRGDMEAALYYSRLASLFVNALDGDNIAYFKEASKLRGLDLGGLRPPLLSMDKEKAEQLKIKLEQLCGLSKIPLDAAGNERI